jgi:hypothetical protein
MASLVTMPHIFTLNGVTLRPNLVKIVQFDMGLLGNTCTWIRYQGWSTFLFIAAKDSFPFGPNGQENLLKLFLKSNSQFSSSLMIII